MSKRPHDDNVIYANFGARKRVSSAAETGGSTASTFQPRSLSPAAMRIYNAAVRQTDVGRAKRGSEYAARGHVVELRAVTQGVRAEVVGSQNDPFRVAMYLPQRSSEDIRRAISALVREPGSIAAATSGLAKTRWWASTPTGRWCAHSPAAWPRAGPKLTRCGRP